MPKGWYSEMGGVQNGYFRRKNYILHNENFERNKQEYVSRCGNKDVYECAYQYETQDFDTCRLIGSPYLDFDIDDINDKRAWDNLVHELKYVVNYIETALGIPAEELELYFSGSKGFHLVIPHECIGLEPDDRLNEIFRYFAMGIAFARNGKNVRATKKDPIDLKIYDRKRLFRLPNSINTKSGRYKVPITIGQLYSFSQEEMLEWASEPREVESRPPQHRSAAEEGFEKVVNLGVDFEEARDGKRRKARRAKLKLKDGEKLDLFPCAKKLLGLGACKGARNNSCFALASSLFQAGYSIDEVYDIIDEWNDKCEVPLTNREFATTIQSSLRNFEAGVVVGCGKYRDLDLCVEDCKLLSDN